MISIIVLAVVAQWLILLDHLDYGLKGHEFKSHQAAAAGPLSKPHNSQLYN